MHWGRGLGQAKAPTEFGSKLPVDGREGYRLDAMVIAKDYHSHTKAR